MRGWGWRGSGRRESEGIMGGWRDSEVGGGDRFHHFLNIFTAAWHVLKQYIRILSQGTSNTA